MFILKNIIKLIVIIVSGVWLYDINQQIRQLPGVVTSFPMSVYIVIALHIFVEDFLKKLILGEKRKKISDTSGKYIDLWWRYIVGTIALLTGLIVIIHTTNYLMVKWFWLIFITLAFGFQLFMQWKFLKEPREYIITLILLLISLLIVVLFS
ncbi:DUF4181 domain-containing protein [Caldalkalibacillus salinus]|uniref:DUF4181 domain-containing protein n=1 Tax=Caldalkalibacillus salinus TaxID=2803787 RepID=UPI001920EACE|nr:DUF4181 domain-containing protein [Caldalkalibacillus salinus]